MVQVAGDTPVDCFGDTFTPFLFRTASCYDRGA
jgi:hypothetical protein